MKPILLRPNAVPVYGFLSAIAAQAQPPEALNGTFKILDCGAGGPLPPLAIFCQQGFETWGIDLSHRQIDQAEQFAQRYHLDLRLRLADMRQIPFEDETFHYVYEHFAMCHLSKPDTAAAIGEMRRVLRPGGLCFLGFISTDTWPHAVFGQEREPGEYWGEEDGDELALHSLFTDAEALTLTSGWEIVSQYKQTRSLRAAAAETSLEDWMNLRREARQAMTPEDWQARYPHREQAFQYAHLYFILKKV